VNGMGPFSLLGSSDDSDANCQPEVQDCSPCLFCQSLEGCYRLLRLTPIS
jgi:hypothetical protein